RLETSTAVPLIWSCDLSGILLGFFANYFGGIFVFPQAQKDRLAQFFIAGPFGKFDLANQDRINPMAFFHFRNCNTRTVTAAVGFGQIDKRASISGDFFKTGMKAGEEFSVKACSYLAAKFQFFTLIKPH